MQVKELVIPDGTTRIVGMIRHTKAHSVGPNDFRLPTIEGFKLCEQVSLFYLGLNNQFSKAMGIEPDTSFIAASEANRAVFTANSIFPSRALITRLKELNLKLLELEIWLNILKL